MPADKPLFHAECLYGGTDDGVCMAGLADDEFDTKRYVLLQRSIEPLPGDHELGLDGVHIEVDDQSRSCYGGILTVELGADSCAFSVSKEAAGALGTAERFIVTFPKAHKKLAAFRENIAEVLAEEKDLFRDTIGK